MLCNVDGLYTVSGKTLLAVLAEKSPNESLAAAVGRTLRSETGGELVVRLLGYDTKRIPKQDMEKTAKGACIASVPGQWIPCERCWTHIMKDVFKNRGRFCAVCGKKDGIEGHHIVPRSERGDHAWTNILPLCGACHDFVELHEKRPRTMEDCIRVGLERSSQGPS